MRATAESSSDYGANDPVMRKYFEQGEAKARNLGNRGPIKFESDGSLSKEILEIYSEMGFYVFENVLAYEELKDLETGVSSILDRLPTSRNADLNKLGEPAIGLHCKAPTLFWSKPLADPFGGTSLANGRHPVKMNEPLPEGKMPDEVVPSGELIVGLNIASNACDNGSAKSCNDKNKDTNSKNNYITFNKRHHIICYHWNST